MNWAWELTVSRGCNINMLLSLIDITTFSQKRLISLLPWTAIFIFLLVENCFFVGKVCKMQRKWGFSSVQSAVN